MYVGRAEPRIIEVGLTKFGNKETPLMYSEKNVFLTNLEQIFKRKVIDFNKNPDNE
jgi:hypothetical protein